MHLHDVQIVGVQSAQALLDAGSYVFRRERVLLAMFVRRHADLTAAFRSKVEVRSTMRQGFADQDLARPVVDRRIDVIDALIDEPVQKPRHVGFGKIARTRRA